MNKMCCVLNAMVRCKACDWVKCDPCIGTDEQVWELYLTHDVESVGCSMREYQDDDYLIIGRHV
jgi:hypothetical protein